MTNDVIMLPAWYLPDRICAICIHMIELPNVGSVLLVEYNELCDKVVQLGPVPLVYKIQVMWYLILMAVN